jgi:hypothetical protein
MPGLVPGIHALLDQKKAWMAGTSPAMMGWTAPDGIIVPDW